MRAECGKKVRFGFEVLATEMTWCLKRVPSG